MLVPPLATGEHAHHRIKQVSNARRVRLILLRELRPQPHGFLKGDYVLFGRDCRIRRSQGEVGPRPPMGLPVRGMFDPGTQAGRGVRDSIRGNNQGLELTDIEYGKRGHYGVQVSHGDTLRAGGG